METSHRIVTMTKTTPHLGIEKMPDHCCEVDCINSSSKRKGTRFFGFSLKDKKRCKRWTNAVRKLNWVQNQYSKMIQ